MTQTGQSSRFVRSRVGTCGDLTEDGFPQEAPLAQGPEVGSIPLP
jgi:hypothetical protein